MDEIISLQIEKQANIADALLQSLNPPDEATTVPWITVANRRRNEVTSGQLTTIPADQVLTISGRPPAMNFKFHLETVEEFEIVVEIHTTHPPCRHHDQSLNTSFRQCLPRIGLQLSLLHSVRAELLDELD